MKNFNEFNLHPSIMKALENKGYKTPTPIQAMSIPHLLMGSDLLGIAQTGTGKTAAFSLPIIHKFGNSPKKMSPRSVRALILTPTRELASQIEQNINYYGGELKLHTKVIFGGVGKGPQVTSLNQGVDILVATPGRLLDLMSEDKVNLSQIEFFVLDEADTMLDMGFLNDVKRIITKIPKSKQTLLFSATMPKDIEELANSLLKNPIKVEAAIESKTVDKVEQKVYLTDKADKTFLLLRILEENHEKSVLIFCKTKFGADRVVEQLSRVPIACASIHSNKSQGAREKALDGFRSGKIRVLVATDIAARGIDVSHVGLVINYNLPEDARNYVHRIGRTARAQREGLAISICIDSEFSLLKNVEKQIQQKIPVDSSHPFHKELSLNGSGSGSSSSKNSKRPSKAKKKKIKYRRF